MILGLFVKSIDKCSFNEQTVHQIHDDRKIANNSAQMIGTAVFMMSPCIKSLLTIHFDVTETSFLVDRNNSRFVWRSRIICGSPYFTSRDYMSETNTSLFSSCPLGFKRTSKVTSAFGRICNTALRRCRLLHREVQRLWTSLIVDLVSQTRSVVFIWAE